MSALRPPWLWAFFVLWSLHIMSMAAMAQKSSVLLSPAEAAQDRLRQAIQQGDASAVERGLSDGANLRRPFKDGPLPLTEAAHRGNPKIVNLLLDRGAPINARTREGDTPLIAAAKAGSAEMVALLLARGADVNARDRRGSTALNQFNHILIQNFSEIAGLLIDHGARLNLADNFGDTPLTAATKSGDLGLMKRMLEQGADPNARNSYGWTAMMQFYGDEATERFRLLQDHGADLHARDKKGMTVLMHAAEHVDSDGFAFLIEKGADVMARDRTGRTAFMLVDEYQGIGIERKLELLLSKGAKVDDRDWEGKTALVHAATMFGAGGQRDRVPHKVRWLREHGAEVNAQSIDGTTPLLVAASVGNNVLVRYLLAEGANPSLRNRKGVSALSWVARYDARSLSEKTETLAALRERGAQVGLVEALLLKDRETARRLLAEGAKAEAFGPFGQTALMLAAEQGYAELVEALMDREARANARDEHGMTPLHFAVRAGYYGLDFVGNYLPTPDPSERERLRIVRALLDHGADVNAASPQRHTAFGDIFHTVKPETPVQWAARWNYVSILKLLLERGASVKGEIGKTALKHAVEAKAAEVAAILRKAGAKE